ncbi:MAG: glycosyltransferase family 2 protein [Patescibacteria group bacterium]
MKKICIIPAYNEAQHIAEVVNRVRPFVDEIIVVDDCSKDATASIAKEAGAHVLSHPINRGQGAALQTGNDYALKNGADIIIHFDADNQFQAEEIPSLTAPIENNQAEAVLGSRFLSKKSELPPFKKNIIMPLARLFNRLFFNIHLTDPQSGFRALSYKAAKQITITNDGMAHCSEILHQLFKNKIKTIEVPITVIYHEYGQKFSGGLRIITDIAIRKIIK